jgi:hypothetical protein
MFRHVIVRSAPPLKARAFHSSRAFTEAFPNHAAANPVKHHHQTQPPSVKDRGEF